MNIADFQREIETKVYDFSLMWVTKQENNPDNFPEEMPFEEWFEQFLSWMEGK